MRHTLQLAALTLLFTAAMGVSAQITNPDSLVANAPRNPARPPIVKPADSFQWLWAFAHPEPIGRAADLRYDARFHALLSNDFNRPQAMWGPAAGQNPPL